MRLLFLGSPAEVISPLRTLIEAAREGRYELLGVVSQPARPAGRKQILTDPPLAAFAKEQGLSVWQPEKASHPEFLEELKKLAPDVIITAAYGQILSDAFLKIPRRATINIHPSLLPSFRGATPIPAALLAGLDETGVTILFTVKALDAGALIVQERFSIGPNETSGQLTDRLFAASGPLLLQGLEYLNDPDFVGTPQNPDAVTHCQKISKTDGQIDWNKPHRQLYNEYRAYAPWPGSFTHFHEQRVVIEEMELVSGSGLKVGSFRFDKERRGLRVGTSDGELLIKRLKPAGSKSIDALSFWNGARLPGEGQFT